MRHFRTAIAALAAGLTISAAPAVPAMAAGQLNLICAADVKWCELMETMFEEDHDIDVNMVRMSSGEAYARIRAEARNPKTDLWWGGTGDPHLQAAAEELTAEYESPMLEELLPWARNQAEVANHRTVGIYSGALGWGYNTEIFEEKGIEPPACWADLTDEQLEGEIQVANPNSSGTAYTTLATLVQLMGEEEAFAFLKDMNSNVSQYTKSGSAPVKSAARGENGLGIVFMHDAVAMTEQGFPIKTVSPCEGTGYEVGSMSIVEGARNLENAKTFYDWALTAEVQSRAEEADSFQIPSNGSASVPEAAPKLDEIKLIDYDFDEYGDPETRQHLLERWDNEIGAIAN